MNLLIITHSYAPDRTPRAFRWSAIAEYWVAKGDRIDVVATGRDGDPALVVRNGVNVHRVGEGAMGKLRRLFGGKRTTPGAGRGFIATSRASAAKVLYDATWRRVYWPDHAMLWYLPALAEAKRLCRTHPYDGMITVSHPFTGHLVGLSLKREFPELRWIADIGDPFSLDGSVPFNNPALYRGLNKRVDAKVYQRSDAVSVTVEGCRAALASAFPVSAGKTQVIPPLLSLTPSCDATDTPLGKNGTIDLVYLGVLYADIRPPDALLALFAAMHARNDSLRLHFFGDIQDCGDAFARYRPLMNTAIFVHGAVPHETAGAIMSKADVLVNIGNDTPFQLPSKLVEYASAGRPILNIGRANLDTAADLLRGYPAALSIVCRDGTPADTQVEQALDFVLAPPAIGSDILEDLVSQFRVERIADAYARLLGGDGTIMGEFAQPTRR